jgi:hypothetical protein
LWLGDGDGDGGRGLAEGVGGVEGVGGGGGGRDRDGCATDCADRGRNNDVGCAGNLPGKSDGRAGRNGSGAGRELRDRGRVAGGDVGAGVERGHLDDVEIGSLNVAEIVEVGIVPAIIGSAAEVHGRAIVGEDEAVFLEGVENDLIGGRETGDVERRFEAEAHAHGWSVLVGRVGGPVRGGRNESRGCALNREANSVLDGAGGDFVVANEAGEDGEAGGVGAGPGVRALLVGEKIPNGAGAYVPLRGLRIGAVELVEETIGTVEDEDVAIAGAGIRVALNGSGERNGHGSGIALGTVGSVVDGNEGLRAVDDGVGDAHGGAVIQTGAEIGMQANGIANEIEEVGGVGIDGRGRDVFVPEIVGREWKEAIEAGALSRGHAGTTGGLLRTIDLQIDGGRFRTAGIGILYHDRKRAGGRGRAGDGELRGGNESGGDGRVGEENLRARDEVAASDGERKVAEIGGGRRDAGEDGSGIHERDGTGGRFGGVGGTGGRDGDRVGRWERSGSGVLARGVDGAECGGTAGGVVDGPGDGGVGGAGNRGGKRGRIADANIGGGRRDRDGDGRWGRGLRVSRRGGGAAGGEREREEEQCGIESRRRCAHR